MTREPLALHASWSLSSGARGSDGDAIAQATLLPPSHFYELRRVPHAGLGVFAKTEIPTGTQVLTTTLSTTSASLKKDDDFSLEPLSPLVWVVQRPYRKEVCAECFLYNRGREWKVKVKDKVGDEDDSNGRSGKDRDCGVVFCSNECRDQWIVRHGDLGIQAWESLEAGVKESTKKARGRQDCAAAQDDSDDSTGKQTGPAEEEIIQTWSRAAAIGEVAVAARVKHNASKNEEKVLRNIIEQGGDPDLMYYILTAVMSVYSIVRHKANGWHEQDEQAGRPEQSLDGCQYKIWSAHSSNASPNQSVFSTPTTTLPPLPIRSLSTLIPSSTAYAEKHTSIHLYTASYLYLLAILPLPLLSYLTPQLCHEINIRAAHNAFSIRPTDGTDGSDSGEFLGWGVWPEASFWNHSCEPNLKKRRVGRQWRFSAAGKGGVIKKGEELCISYLGGEEETLDVVERRRRLDGEWGFVCTCKRCVEEEEAGDDTRPNFVRKEG